MLNRLQRCVAHPTQSKAVLSSSARLLNPVQSATICTQSNKATSRQTRSGVQARPFTTDNKDADKEAIASEVEPVEESLPVEEAEALSPVEEVLEQEIVEAMPEEDGNPEPRKQAFEEVDEFDEFAHKAILRDQDLMQNHQERKLEPITNVEMQVVKQGKADILKQVVTDPNYEAREKFLQGQSPRAVSHKEEKARALSKLAAYNKSAEIMRHIKARIGTDDKMKHYMANELSRSGGEFGKFIANEINQGTRQARETQSAAIKSQEQAKLKAKSAQESKGPVDSASFGTSKKFGERAFVPANENDRLPKHDKNSISSFKEYQEHLAKIGLESEDSLRTKKMLEYDQLFERYNITQEDRKYVFLSDIRKMDPADPEFGLQMAYFNKLASRIPELYFEASRPSMEERVEHNLQLLIKAETAQLRELELARQPYIEKQLTKSKAAFDKKNAKMSPEDRQAAWEVFEANMRAEINVDFNTQLKTFIESSQMRLGASISPAKLDDLSATNILERSSYQAIKEEGPLSIDRVTQDGPRDLYGELKDELSSSPVYDMDKLPQMLLVSQVEMAAFEGRDLTEPAVQYKSPTDKILQEVDGLRDHMEENYDYAKEVESSIDSQRQKLATEVLKLQKNLIKAQKAKENLTQMISSDHYSNSEQQVVPQEKFQDFIEFESKQSTADLNKTLENELKALMKAKQELAKDSKDPQAYESELKVLSTHALLSKELGLPNDQLDHFTFVFSQMHDNKVALTPKINARLFEYAVLADQTQMANNALVKLTKDSTESLSPIDPRYLKNFYEQSLKKDNLDGVAHLTNYSSRYGIDMSEMPINNFRSALDFYLNKKFDLSKIMTFMKFYQQHFQDVAHREFSKIDATQKELSVETIHAASKAIFGKTDGLVDLPVLVDYLVQNVGKRQVIDPFTGEDSLWKFIESQTLDKDFVKAACMSDHCKVDGRTVAKYLSNQFERPSSFDRTFRTALRVDGTPMAEPFFKEMMKQLNDYSLKNKNRLPNSFTVSNLSDLYLRLKLSDTELSPAMSELLLQSLSRQQMHKEVVDFCTQEGKKMTDVEKYYLAESLLQGNLKDSTRLEALKNSKIFDSQNDLSACELTLKTKALFLDGSAKNAIESLKQELAKRESKATQRKELLVALYDSAMPANRTISFQEFSDKHRKSALVTQRILKQAFIVSNLQEIVKNNDYDGIDNAFNLYMVMRQERELLQQKHSLDSNDRVTLINNDQKKLSPKDRDLLESLRQRKAVLSQKLHEEDYIKIKEMLDVSDGAMLDTMGELDSQGLQRVLDTIGKITYSDAMKMEKVATEGDSKKSRRSQQDKVKAIRESVNGAKSIDEALLAAQNNDNQVDWFQAFANRKNMQFEKTMMEIVIENTRYDQQRQKDKAAAQADNELDILTNKNMRGKMSEADMEYYQKQVQDLEKRKRDDFYEIEDDVEKDIQTLEKEQEDFEKLKNDLNEALDAFDENKEAELEAKCLLDAKVSVLSDELSEGRFDGEKDVNERDALSYARTIALMRLEAKDLESQMDTLIEKSHQENPSKAYKNNYNMNDDGQQFAGQVGSQLLEQGSNPSAILNHFKSRQGTRAQFLTVSDELVNAQILPDSLKQVEEQAIKDAEALFAKQTKSTSEESKVLRIDSNTSWENVLRESERLHQNAASNYYFLGQSKSLERSPDSPMHPRELLEELGKEHLNEELADHHNAKVLGLEKMMDQYQYSSGPDSETEIDSEEEDDVAEVIAQDQVYQALEEKYSRTIIHPLNEFQGRSILNVTTQLRQKQQRISQEEELDEYEVESHDWQKTLDDYNKKFYSKTIDRTNMADPINAQAEAHNTSLFELKEELTKAVGERKQEALPLAIQIFNRIQAKTLSTTKLDGFTGKSSDPNQSAKMNNVTESLEKVERLLTDSSSPIMSALRSSSKYSVDKLPDTFDEYRATLKDGDVLSKPLDLNRIINDYKQMGKTEETVQEIATALTQIEQSLGKTQQDFKEKAFKGSYDAFMEQNSEKQRDRNKTELQQLYADYKHSMRNGGDQVSDDEKVRIMRDVLQVQLGEDFVNTEVNKADASFPAFYAIDLVQFGLKQEIPAAIRLGELLLAENCQGHSQAVMPRQLAQAVKDFMFDHQEKYTDAAKITGPINAAQIYHQARQLEGEAPVSLAVDDPYWQDWYDKNYRREDNWKGPSKMAWDHKPYGILGEVLDMKRFEKTMREEQMKV